MDIVVSDEVLKDSWFTKVVSNKGDRKNVKVGEENGVIRGGRARVKADVTG